MKILVFGASGSGTTTLSREIEKNSDFKHLDVDNYYWKRTEPPFQEKMLFAKRNENLKSDFDKHKNAIVSGSMVSWGKEWETSFDLAVFIYLENEKRIARLKEREIERYGEKLSTDKKIQHNSEAFLEWANQYENPSFEGRSLKIHNDWIESLNCKVLRMDGALALNVKVEMVLNEIENYRNY